MVKLLLALTIFAAAWFGGKLPGLIRARSPGSKFLGWSTAFAAGIFLGFGLIHLLGEAGTVWTELGFNPAIAPGLAIAGFMAMLLLEHVLLPPAAHSVVHAHAGEALGAEAAAPLASRSIPWTLLLALSIHSVLAGIALGVESSTAEVWLIFLAIVTHKWSAAFALGISLLKHNVPAKRSSLLLLLFSVSTPAGIAAGSATASLLTSTPGQYFDAGFASLAAGTFVYIGATDILHTESHHSSDRLASWTVTAIGVGVTALLSIWL